MKYLAIDFLGRNEIIGYNFIVDDLKEKEPIKKGFYENENDPSRIGRALYYDLDGLFSKDDGKLIIDIVMCITSLKLLQYLGSINNYIEMTLYNPLIVYSNGNTIPSIRELTEKTGAYGIVEIVRRYYANDDVSKSKKRSR